MTERIRELREQAWALIGDEQRARGELYEAQEQWERCDQKFAELIVQECAKQAYKYTSHSGNYEYYDDNGWDCLPGDLQSHIKDHFGVD